MDLALRFQILRRDKFTCQYCGGKPPIVELHVDHIIPSVLTDDDRPENLISSCKPCNIGKNSSVLTMAEAAIFTRNVPLKPTTYFRYSNSKQMRELYRLPFEEIKEQAEQYRELSKECSAFERWKESESYAEHLLICRFCAHNLKIAKIAMGALLEAENKGHRYPQKGPYHYCLGCGNSFIGRIRLIGHINLTYGNPCFNEFWKQLKEICGVERTNVWNTQ